jgi:hypothetical protein
MPGRITALHHQAGLAAVDLTNPQSLNRYAYALNNPTTLIDPTGLSPGDNCSGKTGASLADCVTGVYCQGRAQALKSSPLP